MLTGLATLIFQFRWQLYVTSLIGLFVGVLIGITTDYFTDDTKKPVKKPVKAKAAEVPVNPLI